MKTSLSALFLCMALVPLASSQEYYSRRYDSLDVNTIFRSSRLLNNYVDCLLDKKPCPPEGKDLKRVLPDALRTNCAQCTKVQKQKALDVITRLYYEHPQIYTALGERYDPAGAYTRNFENWFDEQNAVKPRPSIPQDQREEVPDNVKINRQPTESAIEDATPSTQQAVRRSPVDSNVGVRGNELPTERTRIPTSWVTSTTTTTTMRSTSTRAPLRTTAQPPKRDQPPRSTRTTTNRPLRPNYQIDNIFAPRPNGPISQSFNRLLDTTEKVVSGFAGMFRSTIEIITGTG